MRPCEACFEALRQRVFTRALLYTGGPMVDRNAPWARAFFAGLSRAMHEHVQELTAEESAYLAQQHAQHAAPPAVQAPAAAGQLAPPAAAPQVLPQLPCPAALGDKYPCVKPLGHCDARGKQDWHICLLPSGESERWDEEIDVLAAYARAGVLPMTQGGQAAVVAAAEQAAQAARPKQEGPSEEELAEQIKEGGTEVQKQYMRSIGYVEQPDGSFVKPPPPDAAPAPAPQNGAAQETTQAPGAPAADAGPV
jgi:hypothetical protein